MNAIEHCLNHLASTELAGVVHVNPRDPRWVERYARLGANAVLFVCPQTDVAAAFRLTARTRPEVTVVEAVVAPRAGQGQWRRFNVGELDGLLKADGSKASFPRLRPIDSVPVQTVALGTLLEGNPIGRGGGSNLLVIDLPGQEASLLESLSPTALSAFDWIVLRGAREGLYEGGCTPEAALLWLAAQAYRPVVEARDIEPLWPTTLLRFDRASAERAALERQLADQAARLDTLTRATSDAESVLRDKQARNDVLERELGERAKTVAQQAMAIRALETAKAADAKGLQTCQQEVARLTDEQRRLAAAGAADAQRIQALTAENARLGQLLCEREASIEKLTKARQEHVERLARAERELADLSREKAQADRLAEEDAVRIGQLEAQRHEQADIAARQEAKLQAMASDAEQLKRESEARVVELTKALDRSAAQTAERQARLDALERELAQQQQAARERAEQVSRLSKVRDERTRAVAERDERIGSLERWKAEAEALSEQHDRRIAELSHRLNEQATLAQTRLARSDQLEGELAAVGQRLRDSEARARALDSEKMHLTSERDSNGKLAAERLAQASERQKRVQQLEAELADSSFRLELLHHEVTRAEGQLGLVKEILLREEVL
jgi:chromosome segregation ATPase